MTEKKIIDEVNQLNKLYPHLQSFVLNRDFDEVKGITFQVEMVFVDIMQKDKKLLLKFENVKNLNVENLTPEYSPHGCIVCMEDISQNQWEGLNFEIFDFEEDLFSFFCGNFSYKLI